MTRETRLGGAALIGVVCGMRSAMGPAALAWRGHVGGTRTRPLLMAAALGEVVADKTPLVPWMLARNEAKLVAIPLDGLTKADGEIGPQAMRQRRQIEFERSQMTFIGPELRTEISMSGPIDCRNSTRNARRYSANNSLTSGSW